MLFCVDLFTVQHSQQFDQQLYCICTNINSPNGTLELSLEISLLALFYFLIGYYLWNICITINIVCPLAKTKLHQTRANSKLTQPPTPLPVLRGGYCQVWSSSRCAVEWSSGSRDAPTLSSAAHQLVAGDIYFVTDLKSVYKKVFVTVNLCFLLSYEDSPLSVVHHTCWWQEI